MKHLKLYENNKNYWLFIYIAVDGDFNSNYYKLFGDEESAKNYFISWINDEKSDYIYSTKQRELTDDEKIVTYEEAYEYAEDELHSFYNIIPIEVSGKFELSDELELIKKARKYNI